MELTMELTNVKNLKKLFEKHGLWAKRALGQHFLINQNTLETIVQGGDLKPTDHVIEIGPGPGVLTQKLCEQARSVLTIEKDRKMIELLKETTKQYKNLTILNADALKIIDAQDGVWSGSYKVIANLPYNIATRLLTNLLLSKNPPQKMIVLTQLEVAEKICAKKGDYNVIALTLQAFAKPTIIKKVSPHNFFPPPKVTSAILQLEPYKKSLIPHKLKKIYFQLIHWAFQQKRKKLVNTLAKGLKKNRIDMEKIFKALNIHNNIRPEDVEIKIWIKLARKFTPY